MVVRGVTIEKLSRVLHAQFNEREYVPLVEHKTTRTFLLWGRFPTPTRFVFLICYRIHPGVIISLFNSVCFFLKLIHLRDAFRFDHYFCSHVCHIIVCMLFCTICGFQASGLVFVIGAFSRQNKKGMQKLKLLDFCLDDTVLVHTQGVNRHKK